MSPPRIALAGATGNLGRPILSLLLSTNHSVTVLTRTASLSTTTQNLPKDPLLTIIPVDFTSTASLTPALANIDVVISCLATAAIGAQNPLIDAAVEAGVKRFVPAEFGMDSMNEKCLALPVCKPKGETQKHLNAKVKENSGFSWTAVANGLFLDWCLQEKLIADISNRSATLYNGGDVPFSVTLLSHIAKAVLAIIENQAETANRVVYIQSTVITQKKIIEIAKSIDGGKEWKTVDKNTEDVLKESYGELEKGNGGDAQAAELGFARVGCVTKEYGCDFSGHLDNELLGLKEISEGELRDVIASFM